MYVPGGHNSFSSGMAYASFACDTVTTAVLRADGATAQNFPGSGCSFCQFTCRIQIEVTGIKHVNPLVVLTSVLASQSRWYLALAEILPHDVDAAQYWQANDPSPNRRNDETGYVYRYRVPA